MLIRSIGGGFGKAGASLMVTAVAISSANAQEVPSESELEALAVGVLDTVVFGIDPVVGEHVSDQIRQTAAGLGYRLVAPEEVRRAARRVGLEGHATPADLWRITFLASAARGVATRVWAHEGRYVFEITVASLDGTGPFYGRGAANAEELRATIADALRSTLGRPGTWQAEGDTRQSPTGGAGGGGRGAAGLARALPGRAPGGTSPTDPMFGSSFPGALADGNAPTVGAASQGSGLATFRRLSLAVQTEGAIGTSDDMFYNHLIGVRGDYRFSQDIIAGVYVGYANLRGKNGRVGNLLVMAQIEDRIRILKRGTLTVPLRLGLGYIPFNGPVVRLSAGINIPLGERFELGFDLLAPTFWVIPDGAAVSMDVAAELIWRL